MLEYDRIDTSEGIDTNRNILTSGYVVIGILLIKTLIIKNISVMVVMYVYKSY